MRIALVCFVAAIVSMGTVALATVEGPIDFIKLWNITETGDDNDFAGLLAGTDWYPANAGFELVRMADTFRFVDQGGNFIQAFNDLRIKIYNDDGSLHTKFDLVIHRTDSFPDPGHPDFQPGGADPVFYISNEGDNTPTSGTADERRRQVAGGYLSNAIGLGVASDSSGRVFVASLASFVAYFSTGLGTHVSERLVIRTYDMSNGNFLCQLVVPLQNNKGEIENAFSGVGDYRNGDTVDEIMLTRSMEGGGDAEIWTSEFYDIRTCTRLASPDDKVVNTVSP